MSDDGDRDGARLSPDEAFEVLGNETRLRILRELGEADEPLTFSEAREAAGVEDSGRFNYHLSELVGHFVEKSGDRYRLRRPGRRIVETVLSGAVTGDPTLDRTGIEESCELCGATIEARWRAGSVELLCPACAGKYGRAYAEDRTGSPVEGGYLGRLPLPPAGLRGRSPTEAMRAAWTWGNLEILAISAGICPRCSATVERTPTVCEDHDAGEGLCEECGDLYAVGLHAACTNCVFETGGEFSVALTAETELLDLLTDHGLNPVAPAPASRVNEVHSDYGEEVLSTDPFRARFTFELEGDELTVTVDDELRVVETAR
ncbi:MAG: helix-turn-helix domain-containing protein [Haloarculaceae archaeon]